MSVRVYVREGKQGPNYLKLKKYRTHGNDARNTLVGR